MSSSTQRYRPRRGNGFEPWVMGFSISLLLPLFCWCHFCSRRRNGLWNNLSSLYVCVERLWGISPRVVGLLLPSLLFQWLGCWHCPITNLSLAMHLSKHLLCSPWQYSGHNSYQNRADVVIDTLDIIPMTNESPADIEPMILSSQALLRGWLTMLGFPGAPSELLRKAALVWGLCQTVLEGPCWCSIAWKGLGYGKKSCRYLCNIGTVPNLIGSSIPLKMLSDLFLPHFYFLQFWIGSAVVAPDFSFRNKIQQMKMIDHIVQMNVRLMLYKRNKAERRIHTNRWVGNRNGCMGRIP